MKLVTWNCCRGAYSTKATLLDPLAADIAVIQECAKPKVESESCLWFGENPRQGIAVNASSQFRIRALPTAAEVPQFVFPVEVVGPESFTLMAVWSKGDPKFRYVMGVVKAIEAYREYFDCSPTVIIGDFNSNAIWNTNHPPRLNHSALVNLLSQLGLVSSYHQFFGEDHGMETRPTFFHLWKESRPYHIDYCFVPKTWSPRIESVEIGSYDEWKEISDHRPLTVNILDRATQPSVALPRLSG